MTTSIILNIYRYYVSRKGDDAYAEANGVITIHGYY